MRKTIARISTFIALALMGSAMMAYADVSRGDVERALRQLDRELLKRHTYIDAKHSLIERYNYNLDNAENDASRLDALMVLGDTYNALDNDSALIYYTRGLDEAHSIGDNVSALRFRLKRATLLPLSGFIIDAVNEYEDINPASVPDSLLAIYHDSGRQMYSYISSFFANYPTTRDYWSEKSKTHQTSLLEYQDPESTYYMLNRGESLYESGRLNEARTILTELLNRLSPDSNLYARACHMLAEIARLQGNENESTYYLALSAIADTQGAVLEVMSLQELGVKMSEQGEINRAYEYLSVALSNAVECNAMMRIVQSSAGLPIIQQMQADQARQWQRKIYWIIGVLALMTLVLIVLLLTLRRQMQKTTQLKNRLQNANHVKEVYISQFFRLCSIYIDKLNQFCMIANRKISSGQVDDLYRITKSGKLIEEQSEEFYKLFDDAFLHIYPTFIDDVNALLRDKIVLKEGELLNNDLRILAFLRLGLEDTNQVALILNYSVNTIYAYRNKLRNRAYNRDTFERDIMSIGSI